MVAMYSIFSPIHTGLNAGQVVADSFMFSTVDFDPDCGGRGGDSADPTSLHVMDHPFHGYFDTNSDRGGRGGGAAGGAADPWAAPGQEPVPRARLLLPRPRQWPAVRTFGPLQCAP